jgi:hypothetical protein
MASTDALQQIDMHVRTYSFMPLTITLPTKVNVFTFTVALK